MISDKVTRVTFFVSLTGHILFLGLPGKIFNLCLPTTEKSKDIIIQIEIEKPIYLPKINKVGNEKKINKIKKELKLPEPNVLPELQPEEVVLENSDLQHSQEIIEVIDPAEEAMLRYQDIIKHKIEEKRNYPTLARTQGIEGIVCLKFIILSTGQADKIEIVKSSGEGILDQSTINTLKKANPFPPLPKEIRASYIQMEVTLVYTLKEFN
ncbi:MAG: energy transducer TonB [Elusimicrobiota bacterium]